MCLEELEKRGQILTRLAKKQAELRPKNIAETANTAFSSSKHPGLSFFLSFFSFFFGNYVLLASYLSAIKQFTHRIINNVEIETVIIIIIPTI